MLGYALPLPARLAALVRAAFARLSTPLVSLTDPQAAPGRPSRAGAVCRKPLSTAPAALHPRLVLPLRVRAARQPRHVAPHSRRPIFGPSLTRGSGVFGRIARVRAG